MLFQQMRTAFRAQRVEVLQGNVQMSDGVPMRSRARGSQRGARRILEQRTDVLRLRRVMHESRNVRVVLDEGAQNISVQGLRAGARNGALDGESPKLVAELER